MAKINIKKLSIEELNDFLISNGEKAFRAKQVWQWIWQKGVNSFDEMINLSKNSRKLLEENFYLSALSPLSQQESNDGTLKLGFSLVDNHLIESVMIPANKRVTACISTQVGCKLKCSFCATGELGFYRNLEIEEIYDQIMFVKQLGEERGTPLSNIVFMGMGESLLNYENVTSAIRRLTSQDGLAISPYRITLSTAGIPEGIKRVADDNIRINLAISLHSADDTVRSQLMPINKRYPLKEIAKALTYFVTKSGTRPTLEYLLLGGINDSKEAAAQLARYCRQFPVKINIIEYNQVENSPFVPSSEEAKRDFVEYLKNKNMVVNVRRSRGKDIDAACGQLANKNR